MWDPGTYLRHADERARPFTDLVARIGATHPRRVVDLGCGPGGLTRQLAERWPEAEVLGVDSSPEMVERAHAYATDRCRFAVGDLRSWDPAVGDPVDVVVTNAALQWVPDHLPLLARWAAALPPKGWLAVQVPANFGAPSHVLMRELAGSPRWQDRLAGVLRHSDAVADLTTYADVLAGTGCVVDAWETTYVHVLPGKDPVLGWVRGTGLRPVLAALEPAEAREFETEYAARLRTAYPPQPYGTPFPFTRRFAVAHRPDPG